ncbi:MAG TPA: ATP-binding protein, partial [Myxococcaceae bacterium]|nr:ATP-binding protein [Myxococcaceae bacterium]
QEALVDSIQATKQLEALAINMLSLGRAEDGRWVPTIAKMEIREIVESLARAFKHRLIARKQTLSVCCADEGRMLGDFDLLRRLVENLLDNCVKYSPAGSMIEIEVRTESEGFLELRVKDQGSGIPPELRNRIFEKYVRLERNMQAAAHRSMGLGLAFCRMAAEVHGGRIWVEENEPRGSCFCVRLPVGGPSPRASHRETGAMAAVP